MCDTLCMFGITMVCTFSPRGLRSLYEVREKEASFTEATKGLLGLKLPPEVWCMGLWRLLNGFGVWFQNVNCCAFVNRVAVLFFKSIRCLRTDQCPRSIAHCPARA